MKHLVLLLTMLFGYNSANASDSIQSTELTDEQYQLLWNYFKDSIEQTFKYETGEINLKNNIATIKVPQGFKYLNGKESEMIIVDIWGNPPKMNEEDHSLGMLIPEDKSPLSDSTFAINITYNQEGFIDDSDAKNLDYDELLEQMQADTEEVNQYRIENGYPPTKLIGWASAPFYDSATKKLHWAKELQFGEFAEHTLNYNIRILGRKGYLELNAIGDMFILDQVKEQINPILSNVNFTDGNKYSDFNPNMDKIAGYGIGGLIAGKMMAKAGLFAKLGLVFAKFWKIIAIAVIGFFAGIRKLFGGKDEKAEIS